MPDRRPDPAGATPASDSQAETVWRLSERVKELTALHATARIVQDARQSPETLLSLALDLLPPAWQFPEITEARLAFGDVERATPGWRATPWMLHSSFRVASGLSGCVSVAYTEPRPPRSEGPFLAEERALIDSIAELLHGWFQRRAADEELERIRKNLERLVEERTADLSEANSSLRREVAEHRAARSTIERYQQQLRDMTIAVCRAGERERRAIAQALHDHVGQSLAFARMRLVDLRGNAIFCGFEEDLAHLLQLLDAALHYTRDLTCELSPPLLYELGLDAALARLADQYRTQHKVNVHYRGCGDLRDLDEEGRIVLHAAARELLANAIRHAQPTNVHVDLSADQHRVRLEVRDDGCGFDPGAAGADAAPGGSRFGLFSIRERLRSRNGVLHLDSSPGQGCRVQVEMARAPEAGP